MKTITFWDGIGSLFAMHVLFAIIAYFDPNTTAVEVFRSWYFMTGGFVIIYFFVAKRVEQ